MEKAIIWDLDGTLLDSYDVIVESLHLALLEVGAVISKEEIHRHAISVSSQSLIERVAKEKNVSAEQLLKRYSQISGERYLSVKPMNGAQQVLQELQMRGVGNFVFTHRGKTTMPVLENLGMDRFFIRILTSQSGFARKPAPDAILYLMQAYSLDKKTTYYVGDRAIDMQSARNAGIPGILFLLPGSHGAATGAETYVVSDLMQILDIV